MIIVLLLINSIRLCDAGDAGVPKKELRIL